MPVYNAKNPLESLNGSPYTFNSLTYPLEFDDIANFGHYMNFYINVNKSTKYMSGGSYNVATNGSTAVDYSKVYTPAYNSQLPGGGYQQTEATTLGGNAGFPGGNPFYVGLAQDVLSNLGFSFDQESLNKLSQTRITQAISLYIPDSMSFACNYDWQDASLTEAGGKALKYGQLGGGAIQAGRDYLKGKASEGLRHLGAAALSDVLMGGGQGGIGDIAMGMAGFAVNPQIFVLFRGVDLRTFQFDFIFTPKSPAEAANVRNIIKAFRFHAAPEIDKSIGRYMIAPSTFNIEYMYKTSRNENIFQMSTCVLQKLSVDYAPYGWATYNDGMPVQTQLSMVFKETEILTKERINQGY